MTNVSTTTRKPPTVAQINEQQKRDAERALAQKAAPSTAVALTPPSSNAPVAGPDTRSAVQRFIDDTAPASVVGRMVKFAKDGKYTITDDDTTIADSAVFIALVDQMLNGWVRFNGQGEAPTRHMGLPFEGFVMAARDTLGDDDPATWKLVSMVGLKNSWQHHVYLVVQEADTQELFTFVTSSKTGRRAIGNLVRHYERLRTHPDHYPLIRLARGGFQHKDPRVGFVHTPNFAIVGRHPKDSAAKPDTSSEAAFDDRIPF